MNIMSKILLWLKQNWFLWLFIILFYIGLRLCGYDIKIEKKEQPVLIDKRPKVDY